MLSHARAQPGRDSTAARLVVRTGSRPSSLGPEDNLELSRFVGIMLKWSWLILLCAVIGGTVTYVISVQLPKMYRSEALVLIGSLTIPDLQQQLAFQQMAQTYASLAVTRPLLEGVHASARDDVSHADLASRVSARALTGQNLVIVSASDADPVRAASLANAVASELVARSAGVNGGSGLASIAQPGAVPASPYSPLVSLNAVVGATLGGGVGVALALLLDHWRRQRSSRTLRRLLGT